jgi:hypothetical protein
MMQVSIDETGNRYGRLVVIERAAQSTQNRKARWICRCDCGTLKPITGASLRKKTTQSCGCLSKEMTSKRNALRRYDSLRRRKINVLDRFDEDIL